MFKKFMYGRYGFDYYTLMIMLFSLLLMGTHFLWPIGIVLIGYALFRALSRNVDKRVRELNGFTRIFSAYLRFFYTAFHRIKQFFGFQTRRIRERKTSVLIRCPRCKNTLRLPRKKGTLEVSCPVCSISFNKRT